MPFNFLLEKLNKVLWPPLVKGMEMCQHISHYKSLTFLILCVCILNNAECLPRENKWILLFPRLQHNKTVVIRGRSEPFLKPMHMDNSGSTSWERCYGGSYIRMHECKPLVALLYTPLLCTHNTATRTEILHLLYSIFIVHNLINTSDTQSSFIRKRHAVQTHSERTTVPTYMACIDELYHKTLQAYTALTHCQRENRKRFIKTETCFNRVFFFVYFFFLFCISWEDETCFLD